MVLSVKGIDKEFGERKILQDISFSIDKGEFVCITGPSGCGKSTLLKILAGLVPASKGEIVMQNQEIGFVFQEGALFPWLTVAENIAFGMRMHGMDKAMIELEVQRLLHRVNLNGKEQLYPAQLSGGMRLRAAMARSLAYHPDLVLMDEPLGALDFRTRNKMQQELLEICRKEGASFLMVTHNIDELVYMSDRAIILSAEPAKVIREMRIDLPWPRDRTGTAFNCIRRQILDLLE